MVQYCPLGKQSTACLAYTGYLIQTVALEPVEVAISAGLSYPWVYWEVGKHMAKISHPSFIEGRVAEVVVGNKSIGVVGEVSPVVLKNWQMEMPVAAFEISLEVF